MHLAWQGTSETKVACGHTVRALDPQGGGIKMRSLFISVVLMMSVSTANAQEVMVPPSGLYFGIFGGGNLVLDNWDLYHSADGGVSPDHSGIFGVRIGGQIIPHLALEAGIGVLPYTAENDEGGIALSYTGDLLINFIEGRWVPFLILGGGAYHNVDGPFGSDVDYHAHYGLGLRGQINDWFGFRIDVRHMMTDTYDGVVASNLEITAGLDFWAIAEKRIQDTDNDGLLDNVDRCVTTPGPAEHKGCPDTDGDGLVDIDDTCPKIKGLKAFRGCPDTDGDGIADREDACPTVFGIVEMKGCPDKDRDGVLDGEDECPNVKGPAKYKGCPDTDGDGIIDIKDKCPKRAGVPEEQGCPFVPKEIKEQFSGTLEGIYFATGSAKIRPKSFSILDNVATTLVKYVDIKIRIEGHTDNRGNDEKNQKLSEARAQSVRSYLVGKGIAANRLTAIGFGEAKPVATNKSRKGRTQNRRIEFHIAE